MLKVSNGLFFTILIDDKICFFQVINISSTAILNRYRQSYSINSHFIGRFFYPHLAGFFLTGSNQREKQDKNQG